MPTLKPAPDPRRRHPTRPLSAGVRLVMHDPTLFTVEVEIKKPKPIRWITVAMYEWDAPRARLLRRELAEVVPPLGVLRKMAGIMRQLG